MVIVLTKFNLYDCPLPSMARFFCNKLRGLVSFRAAERGSGGVSVPGPGGSRGPGRQKTLIFAPPIFRLNIPIIYAKHYPMHFVIKLGHLIEKKFINRLIEQGVD